MNEPKETSERKQVKSRDRVRDHGEVFTAEREVKAMCDLVKDETERIDSRFLEPACGVGNFLAEILSRKLATVVRLSAEGSGSFAALSAEAVSSLYGIELLPDNAAECRERLFQIWRDAAPADKCSDAEEAGIRSILSRNIVTGNALSMRCVGESGAETDEPIVFTEWTWHDRKRGEVSRREFRFDSLLHDETDTLFADVEPLPIREYPPVDFRRIVDE